MALEDIVFPDGDPQNIIITLNRGNIGVVDDVLTEPDSNPGMLLNEIPQAESAAATVATTWVS